MKKPPKLKRLTGSSPNKICGTVKKLLIIPLVVGTCFVTTGLAAELPIIPLPQSTSINGQSFSISSSTAILHDAALANEAALLAVKLKQATGIDIPLLPLSERGSASTAISLTLDAALTNAESYELTVETNDILIAGADAAGAFYGAQSLLQIVPMAAPYDVAGCSVADAPRFKWRGMHLDVGRHMFAVDDIKKFIDSMAYHKLNSFHWHLTEDQGWRIEIQSYPLLTSIGAYRDSTPPYGNASGSDGTPYGGFYTQVEVAEIVAYAAERHITVIPEIDMPGHMSAAIAAYPWLGNDDIAGYDPKVQSQWGIFPYTLSPKETTFEWIDDVLTEVCALFPSTYIHIGGDEAPKTQWQQSATAQSVMSANNLHDEHELQAWFINRVETILTSKGRKLIGWHEIREGGLLSSTAAVMNWDNAATAAAAAQAGHDVVVANNGDTYFDYYQNHSELELAKGVEFEAPNWGAYLPIEQVYNFEPIPAAIQGTSAAQHILGCQAQLWTEYMHTWDKVEYMAYPRMAAIAEVAWIDPSDKNLGDFESRLQSLMTRYIADGINCFNPNGDIIDGATIQTTLGQNQKYLPAYAYDGNVDTYFWSNRGLNTSDHFTIDLNHTHAGTVTVITGKPSDGSDKLISGEVEASTNGTDWSTVATFTDGVATGSLPNNTTHLRIVPTANQANWLAIREIVIDAPLVLPDGITDWLAQAAATQGNVTASHNSGAGWAFNGSSGVDYDFGALDELEGKPVDGSTVEFIFNYSDEGASITLASVGGWAPGGEMNVLKLEQWNNTGKFGITVPGLWDYTWATDSVFDQNVHVVFVRNNDGGTLDLYVNGVFVETDTNKTDWRMDGGLGKLGTNTADADVPTGDLYGVASYDVALNATQIANLYSAFSNGGSNNSAPVWNSNPVVEAVATEDAAYASSLADNASDPDSDPMTFSKVSGPSWLSISPNGDLTGTPSSADIGSNQWTVRASDDSGLTTDATLDITVNPDTSGNTTYSATAENTTLGSASGGFAATTASDNSYETLTEAQTGGNPSKKRSHLEHQWTFDVTSGVATTLRVEAHHTTNSEGDDFIFAYSTDGSTYTDVLTVSKTGDDNTEQTAALPSSLNGTVYIRVVDADRSQGNSSVDSLYVDLLAIDVTPLTGPPAAAGTPSPANAATGTSLTPTLTWDAAGGANSYDVYFGASAPGASQGNQSGTSFSPGTLSASTVYYWRVDSVNGNGVTTGTVWSFTTGAGGSSSLFSDDFEDGNVAGWSTSGTVSANTAAANTGAYGARLRSTASMTVTVDTSSSSSVDLSYDRTTSGFDNGESLTVEWSTDGTNWTNVESTSSSVWGTTNVTLPTGAAGQAALQIRFSTNANRNNENAYIDNVVVNGS